MLFSNLLPLAFLLCSTLVSAQTLLKYLTSTDANAPFTTTVNTGIPANSIQIPNYTIAFDQTSSSGATGLRMGKAAFEPLQVLKRIDANTPTFFTRLAAGNILTGITLGLYQPAVSASAAPTLFMEYKFSGVAISAIAATGMTESISFQYAKVVQVFHGTTSTGTSMTSTGGWNIVTNTHTS